MRHNQVSRFRQFKSLKNRLLYLFQSSDEVPNVFGRRRKAPLKYAEVNRVRI